MEEALSPLTKYFTENSSTPGNCSRQVKMSEENSLKISSEIKKNSYFNDCLVFLQRCGTEYEVYMLAVNSLGAGKHSKIVKRTTLGTLPAGPAHTELLALNTTWIGLNLHTWSDGNCPISSFVIEYR